MSAFALMLLLHRVPGKWFSKARAQVNFGELGNNTDMGVTGGVGRCPEDTTARVGHKQAQPEPSPHIQRFYFH